LARNYYNAGGQQASKPLPLPVRVRAGGVMKKATPRLSNLSPNDARMSKHIDVKPASAHD